MRFFLAIMLVFVLLYWAYFNEKSPDTAVQAPVGHAVDVLEVEPNRPEDAIVDYSKVGEPNPKIKTIEKTQPIPEETKDSFYKRVAKDRLVPFEVEGELAIAYGDVVIGKLDDYQRNVENVRSGFADLPRSRLWPSNTIPYIIDERVKQKREIQKALNRFESQTNIRFVKSSGDEDQIVFTTGEKHCFSHLGRIGGPQPIYLSPECDAKAISHEIMHALGFFHEQSRTDRDGYIEIIWENIDPKFEGQFAMVPQDFMDIVEGFSFDFESIMLYPPNAFSIDGKRETMESMTGDMIAPTKAYFSKADIEKINRSYPLY